MSCCAWMAESSSKEVLLQSSAAATASCAARRLRNTRKLSTSDDHSLVVHEHVEMFERFENCGATAHS